MVRRDRYGAVDDDELLSRSARDPQAFGAFYERHERLVLGYLVRQVGDPELAADSPPRRSPPLCWRRAGSAPTEPPRRPG